MTATTLLLLMTAAAGADDSWLAVHTDATCLHGIWRSRSWSALSVSGTRL
jgi:hypothetical protein